MTDLKDAAGQRLWELKKHELRLGSGGSFEQRRWARCEWRVCLSPMLRMCVVVSECGVV